MHSMLRSAIIGMLAFGLATPSLAMADAASARGEGVVWRLSADGDWLVGMRSDTTPVTPLRPATLRPSYVEPRPAGAAARPAIVLRIDQGGAESPPIAQGCGLPLWMSLGSAGACLGAPSAASTGASARLSWVEPAFEVGVRAGTSTGQLPAGGSLAVAAQAVEGASAWPLVVGMHGAGGLAVDRFGFDGRVRLGDDLGLRWAAGVVHAEAVGPTAGNDRGFDQQALSLGLTRGTWSGGLTGRLTRPRPAVGSPNEIGALDLEVQWVTPWEGELSFGAENLILREQDRQPALPAARSQQAPARTPFVRYRQDF
ncbi:MAG: hypothetical protein N2439_15980 [Anaerolineae bacterium]|nr:hypothetical protein [Anaerolineae bacterium]